VSYPDLLLLDEPSEGVQSSIVDEVGAASLEDEDAITEYLAV
jgi:ABC-type branched-subunit amino acid transport system ATPase component